MAEKKLVIVESPSKAKTITKFLGKNYKVVASQGHVRDLPKSQLGVDVEQDFDMKYITIRGKGPLMAQIRKLAKSSDKIYLATDPDREGEAISWHLAEMLNINPESNCRVEFNEITKEAVQKAVKSPRPVDMHRVDAQQARRALDRLVGYGISPLLWAKVKKRLSAGRVQSVATRLVVDREREIEEFIPEEYWDISVDLGEKTSFINARLTHLDNEKLNITNESDAKVAQSRIESAKLVITSIKNSEKKRNPSPPFITSTLQQAANTRLNFTAAKTMQIVQQLYEGISLGKKGTVGLVTYIRTDSVRISESALTQTRDYIVQTYGAAYLPETPNYYKGKKNIQDAHEAIRPTYLDNKPSEIKEFLTRDQYKLYNLIYTRFIASQMKPALFDTKNIIIEADGIRLISSFEVLKFEGFMKTYASDEENSKQKKMPENFQEGQKMNVVKVYPKQHFTEAKPHFTEASLVKELEEKGIGRPSTYAPTISTIISRGYISRENKTLYASDLGIIVTDLLTAYFNDIVDYDFTANLEDNLDHVEEGTLDWKNAVRDFYPTFCEELKKAEEAIEKIEIKDEESDIICEKCGRIMVYKMGKYGKFLACPGFPECTNTLPIVEYIHVPCPKCKGELVKKISNKRKRVFYGCENYPNCDFTSWDKPSTKTCEKCGTYMLEKISKKKKIYLCANKACNHKIEEDNE